MLGLRGLLRCVGEGDWFKSLDLKDPYFHVPVRQADRKFLRFAFMAVAYVYQCLPFGYSLCHQLGKELSSRQIVYFTQPP